MSFRIGLLALRHAASLVGGDGSEGARSWICPGVWTRRREFVILPQIWVAKNDA